MREIGKKISTVSITNLRQMDTSRVRILKKKGKLFSKSEVMGNVLESFKLKMYTIFSLDSVLNFYFVWTANQVINMLPLFWSGQNL